MRAMLFVQVGKDAPVIARTWRHPALVPEVLFEGRAPESHRCQAVVRASRADSWWVVGCDSADAGRKTIRLSRFTHVRWQTWSNGRESGRILASGARS